MVVVVEPGAVVELVVVEPGVVAELVEEVVVGAKAVLRLKVVRGALKSSTEPMALNAATKTLVEDDAAASGPVTRGPPVMRVRSWTIQVD